MFSKAIHFERLEHYIHQSAESGHGQNSSARIYIAPVFVKTSPKCSYSVIENERFGLVFAKTGSIISGTGQAQLKLHGLIVIAQCFLENIPLGEEGHWKGWALNLTTYTTEYRIQNAEHRTQNTRS
jgi:hypothetical protein